MPSTPSSMPWIKSHISILDDINLANITDALKWRLQQLKLLAGECDACGYLIRDNKPMTITAIAWRLRIVEDQIKADIESLRSADLIQINDDAILVVGFAEDQGRSQSELRERWLEYQRRHRSKSVINDKDLTGRSVINDNTLTPPHVINDNTLTPPPVINVSGIRDRDRDRDREDNLINTSSSFSKLIAKELRVAEYNGGAEPWLKAIDKMLEANVTEDDIRQAITRLRDPRNKRTYTLVGPQSIQKAAINIMRDRTRSSDGNDATVPADALLAAGITEYKRVV